MANFNFENEAERARAVERALSLKPRQDGVYANASGYVIDRPNGTTEILVSFRNLNELLGTSETSVAEIVPEVTIVAEAAPVEASVQVVDEPAKAEDETEEVKAVTETKEERKARRAAEKAAKAAE